MVNCCAGSALCLLYNQKEAPEDDSEDFETEPLTQVITGIDVDKGSFTWIDKDDLMKVCEKAAKEPISEDSLCQVFAAMGGLYGLSLIDDVSLAGRKEFLQKAL